ncbi:unnamed protein product [Moneuplotes crassus]|uniref:Uncharacterized protein n=1 Tax=Euplotes crassus TaxID=5936 RepID=A0AAD1XZI0_EUPCR|nr:unnamed protein product [Moneuplotes crassus]
MSEQSAQKAPNQLFRSVEQIADQQRRKSTKMIFPESLFFCLRACDFSKTSFDAYQREHRSLFLHSFYPMYAIPLACAVSYDMKSILAFPVVCLLTTLYFYFQNCKDIKYTMVDANLGIFSTAKLKMKQRQEMMRFLCWKYSSQSKQIETLDDIEQMLDTELALLSKRKEYA